MGTVFTLCRGVLAQRRSNGMKNQNTLMFVVVGLTGLTLVTVIVGGFVILGKMPGSEKSKPAITAAGEELGMLKEIGEIVVTINPVRDGHGLRLNLFLQMEKEQNKKKE